jgi:hypothetical protein
MPYASASRPDETTAERLGTEGRAIAGKLGRHDAVRMSFFLPYDHRRMAKGSHDLPNVSTGPAVPYLSTPCKRATPEMALWFQGWLAHKAVGLRPSSTPLDTPRRTLKLMTARFCD